MQYVTVGFLVAYLILVLFYLRPPKSDQKHGRVWNKTSMAVLYYLYALVAFFAARRMEPLVLLAVLTGLFFCMVGDVVIQFRFITGAVFFFVANLVFIGFQLWSLKDLGLALRDVWWFLPVAVIPLFAVVELERHKWLKLGHLAGIAVLYLTSVTFSGMLGIAIAVASGSLGRWLLGVGLALYMISDYFLIYREFRRSRRFAQVGNTLTYFIGMMIVSLSVMEL